MGDGFGALVFGVHACVQHHPGVACFEQIGIRADSGVATEAFENHGADGARRSDGACHGGGMCQPSRRTGGFRGDDPGIDRFPRR
jgi:hypothetical protein